MTNEEITAGGSPIIEFIDDAVLGRGIKVNHDIAAENKVERTLKVEWLHEVAGAENYFFPDAVTDLVVSLG